MKLEELYEHFNEDERLKTTKANSIEFITTDHFIQKYLKEDSKLLELGAATGAYSIHYAKQGYDVTAVEPVEKNLNILKSKITNDMKVTPILGNALDLSMLEDNTFDIIMCLGPFYHLKTNEERVQSINEMKRVVKDDGIILIAYISHDMIVICEQMRYDSHLLVDDSVYNSKEHRLVDEPFTFLTYDDMKECAKDNNLTLIEEFAQDGTSELFADKINAMSEEEYQNWLSYHFYICQKKELIGFSNHIAGIYRK